MSALTFDAWHLPGIEPEELAIVKVGGLRCRYPVPTGALIGEVTRSLLDAGSELKERPVAELVGVIDTAAARLATDADPLRQEAERLVAAATGYSEAMTRLVLDRMTADWKGERLRALLGTELGDPAVLDGFQPAGPGRSARAYGPKLALQVFAGNVPGVAVTALVRALLVKAPSLGKLASGQPVLPVLFARAVSSVDPAVGRAVGVTYWPAGDRNARAHALRAADVVVVYGGAEAEAAYRQAVAPGARFVAHGPRFSAGLIARECCRAEGGGLVRDVARAVAAFDQHGCVSPHAVWIEEGGTASPEEMASALAESLDAVEKELPRGRIGPGEAAAIQQERAAAELRGHTPAGAGIRVLTGERTSWTVIFDPEPSFRPSCLNRLVRVHPVASLDVATNALAVAGGLLQSVALAADPDRSADLAHRLALAGATRITSFRNLPWPPPSWHHDGGEPLRELIRWVDLEE